MSHPSLMWKNLKNTSMCIKGQKKKPHPHYFSFCFKDPRAKEETSALLLICLPPPGTQSQDLQRHRNVWEKIRLYQGHISNCSSLKHINLLPPSGVNHFLWTQGVGGQIKVLVQHKERVTGRQPGSALLSRFTVVLNVACQNLSCW